MRSAFQNILIMCMCLSFFVPVMEVHAQDAITCEQFIDQAACESSTSEDGAGCTWLEEPDEGEERCVEATPGQLEEEAQKTEAEEHLKYELPEGIKERLNPLDIESVSVLIGRLIKIFMQIVGSIALLMFIYGGVLWMIDAGNSEKQKLAMKIIVWSSLGIVVILASYILVDFAFEAFR